MQYRLDLNKSTSYHTYGVSFLHLLSDTLVLTKLSCAADVVFTVTLTTELLQSVVLCGNLLNRNKIAFLSSLPPFIHSLSDLTTLLSALDSVRLCIGYSEQSFIEVV